MDLLTSEICWALNNEIIKQVTSSWSLYIELSVQFGHFSTQSMAQNLQFVFQTLLEIVFSAARVRLFYLIVAIWHFYSTCSLMLRLGSAWLRFSVICYIENRPSNLTVTYQKTYPRLMRNVHCWMKYWVTLPMLRTVRPWLLSWAGELSLYPRNQIIKKAFNIIEPCTSN